MVIDKFQQSNKQKATRKTRDWNVLTKPYKSTSTIHSIYKTWTFPEINNKGSNGIRKSKKIPKV